MDVIELAGRDVEPSGRRAAVGGENRAVVVSDHDPLRIVRRDPDDVVVAAAERAA